MKDRTLVWKCPITDPCVIKGMPMSVYHAQCCEGPSVSAGNLKRVLECNGGSPAHMYCEWSGNPRQIPRADTPYMALGRAVHHWLLGEPDFNAHFVVRREWDSWRTEESRRWRDLNTLAGKTVLTEEDEQKIIGMGMSLSKDPLIQQGILTGHIERSFIWKDKETGLWCKARPDAVPTDSGDFADLKATMSVQYSALTRNLRERAHQQQAAMIAEGAKRCLGIDMTSFTFVFVEHSPPYCVRHVQLKPDDLALGNKQNRAALRLIAACINSGVWPGPGDGNIVNLDIGNWYRDEADRNLSDIDRLFDLTKRRAS